MHLHSKRAFVALTWIVSLVTLGTLGPVGCRNIIGVEARELVGVSCDSYCTDISSQCTGTKSQYATAAACTNMCATFAAGTIDDQSTNTLGCRQSLLETGMTVGEVDCQASGLTGTASCGSKCEVYCASLEALCIEEFSTFQGNCLTECAKIPDCGDYVADATRDDDSIQCRLFHLTSAAVAPETHCPHSIAIGHCSETTLCDGT